MPDANASLVSIVMPAYNCEAYVDAAIKSVLQQSYVHWELLIADDCSSDRTRERINSFADPRVKRFHNSVNRGAIATRNHLFAQATGEFITMLDADDFMERDRIEVQLNAFKRDKDLGACLTNFYEIDVQGNSKMKHDIKEDLYLNCENFHGSFYSMPATIMLKREAYATVGGLHMYFDRLFAEDKYWLYTIVEQYKTLLLKSPLYYYRANPFSLTNWLDNPRKLTVVALVDELIRQRKLNGKDWLAQGALDKALAYEQDLMRDKTWLSEQYRIYAARYIDLKKLRQALSLLARSFSLDPFNPSIARTLFYLLRRIV